MKKVRMIFNVRLAIVIGMMVLCVLASCSKGGDGGGGMDPFGGGGGGNNSSLVGKWTSVSATGTVGYTNSQLGNSLTQVVNSNISGYGLENVVDFLFEANGKLTLYDFGTVFEQGTYSLKGNTLTLKNNQNDVLNLNITLSGNEFTLDASGTDIAALVAWAIGDHVLRGNGYAGMTQNGIEVTAANLILKFKKQ